MFRPKTSVSAPVSSNWGAARRRFLGLCLATTAALSSVAFPACTPSGVEEAHWPPTLKKWYDRGLAGYRSLDYEDAAVAVERALALEPARKEVRLLAARIALSDLRYADALKHTHGLNSSEALSLRGRAFWYDGKISEAADVLEQLLQDPDVRDPWAQGVIKLARQGSGRQPFTVKGDLLAVSEMPRLGSTAMVVPIEMNGQPVLAMVSTGTAEVVVDSAGGREPSWVSLRFDRRIEVKDVPTLTRDLSGLSRELNAPVKVLLGTHVLRHLNATVDLLGRQFVVRTYEPPPPPVATKIDVHYVRGGGMVFRGHIGKNETAPPYAFLIDTGSMFPVVLDEPAWERTQIDLGQRRPIPGSSGLRQALLPHLQIGAFSLPQVPAVSGVPLEEMEKALGVDLDGVVGSGLLGAFRITLADRGRTMWLEDAPQPAGAELAVPDAPPDAG